MQYTSKNRFNKIIVLESLMDLHTGKTLYENVLMWKKLNYKKLSCEFRPIPDKRTLTKELNDIIDETELKSTYPVIHIEAHGDKNGLSLASNEYMEWYELLPFLQRINIACKNHMLITLAACCGIYLTKIARPTEPVPFWALVAPAKTISARDLEISFQSFYEEILTSLNGDTALQKLNNSYVQENTRYVFWPCTLIFKEAYAAYYHNHCRGKAFRRRQENLLTAFVKKYPGSQLCTARKMIKSALIGGEDIFFRECTDKFFMIDRYPENRERFPLTKEECISKSFFHPRV